MVQFYGPLGVEFVFEVLTSLSTVSKKTLPPSYAQKPRNS